ncbi:MAG: N-6 DNA methylase [Prevotella sp.]|nr:N-6 DNA methylase [Prevotella sp.]
MITGEVKQKVDAIWQTFWNGEISSPITIMEQLTYLLFIKLLDDKQIVKESNANMWGEKLRNPIFGDGMWHNPETDKNVSFESLRWHNLINLSPDEMLNAIRNDAFVFIKNFSNQTSAYSKSMHNAVFIITDARMLSRVVDLIDGLDTENKDNMGDVYEYMLDKMASTGKNGQFRTPRHIIRMMVEMMKPTLDDIICDPAMGSAGFVMEAASYIKEHEEEKLLNETNLRKYKSEIFHGYDKDDTMMRIGCMNMMLHNVDKPQMLKCNSLSDDNEDNDRYTLCLANPPFAGSLDMDDIAASLLSAVKTKKTELLFLALFMRMLKRGGRCASIVPDTVLTGDNEAYKTIRKTLVKEHCLQGVISMPSGVFQPYSGVSTAIIIFTKTGTGGTNKVWFYDMRNDGYSLTTQRNPINDNDIPDILQRFEHLDKESERSREDQSFLVSADDISKNGFDLSYKKYHKVEHVKVEYEATDSIVSRIGERYAQLNTAFEELKKMLED